MYTNYSNDKQRQAAFENACDYHYYGCGRDDWERRGHNCGLDPDASLKVWKASFWWMAEGHIPTEYKD